MFAGVMNDASHSFVIHYSCESFYERPEGTSPRITSIAVRNIESGQTNSFSIHQVAERRGLRASQINQHYDDLERKMLDEFYAFVDRHRNYNWVHWNMRDINYGFQAIEHRYRVLGGDPIEIQERSKLDLARVMVNFYSVKYIGHPRLQKLVEKNRITDRDFLSGAEEAAAFEEADYVKLHLSTLRKVDVMANIAHRFDEGTLETNAGFRDKYGIHPQAIVELVREHWIIGLISIFVVLIAFGSAIFWLLSAIL